ncbi:MAG: PIN domain-containing protein [Bryobacterales bacterium]|nr:PIN domain-containing protein [Bryobacterales bacterium]
MTNFLADVNVWVALTVVEHVHHAAAREWFEEPDTQLAAFCRVTQHGLLRLLSNSKVMGNDALTASRAWNIYDALLEHSRVFLVPEPAELESHWREGTRHHTTGPNFWTDAFLRAFAAAGGYTIVTFDRGFTRQRQARVHLLKP